MQTGNGPLVVALNLMHNADNFQLKALTSIAVRTTLSKLYLRHFQKDSSLGIVRHVVTLM